MYTKIALAADGSEHAKRAAEHAIKLAKSNPESFLEILYVIDHDKAKSEVLNHWNVVDITEKRKTKLRAIEKLAIESKVKYEIKILHGEPGPEIVDFVNKNEIDLVVIGSRGLNVLQEFVLGSVSHKVAKRAHCPVLIVK